MSENIVILKVLFDHLENEVGGNSMKGVEHKFVKLNTYLPVSKAIRELVTTLGIKKDPDTLRLRMKRTQEYLDEGETLRAYHLEHKDEIEISVKPRHLMPEMLLAESLKDMRVGYKPTLHLKHMNLAALPGLETVRDLEVMSAIDASHNKLCALPKQIGVLVHLVEINVNHNELEALPAELALLTNLKRLYLQFNHIHKLPPEMGEMQGLETLNVRHNDITAIPHELHKLWRLSEFHINNNPLSYDFLEIQDSSAGVIRKFLQNHVKASPSSDWSTIDARQSTLVPAPKASKVRRPVTVASSAPAHGQLGTGSLATRNVNRAKVQDKVIPRPRRIVSESEQQLALNRAEAEIQKASREGWGLLDMGNWNLIRVPRCDLLGSGNVSKWTLSSNSLTAVPTELALVSSLTNLSLRDNYIQEIPPVVCTLPKLKQFDLALNELTSLPDNMSRMSSLTHLDLSGNSFARLPPAVWGLAAPKSSAMRVLVAHTNPLSDSMTHEASEAGGSDLILFIRSKKEFLQKRVRRQLLPKNVPLLHDLEVFVSTLSSWNSLPKDVKGALGPPDRAVESLCTALVTIGTTGDTRAGVLRLNKIVEMSAQVKYDDERMESLLRSVFKVQEQALAAQGASAAAPSGQSVDPRFSMAAIPPVRSATTTGIGIERRVNTQPAPADRAELARPLSIGVGGPPQFQLPTPLASRAALHAVSGPSGVVPQGPDSKPSVPHPVPPPQPSAAIPPPISAPGASAELVPGLNALRARVQTLSWPQVSADVTQQRRRAIDAALMKGVTHVHGLNAQKAESIVGLMAPLSDGDLQQKVIQLAKMATQ